MKTSRALAKFNSNQLKAVCKAIRLGIIVGPLVPRNALRRLTRHQWQICIAVHEGLTNKELGTRFAITEFTAKTHLQQIFDKLDVRSRYQLAAVVEIITMPS